MSYTNLGSAGWLAVVDGDSTDSDALVYNGTAASDSFIVGIGAISSTPALRCRRSVSSSWCINALGGDDLIQIDGDVLFVDGIRVMGGDNGTFTADRLIRDDAE